MRKTTFVLTFFVILLTACANLAENEDIDIDYYKYIGADHNLRPSWDNVVTRDLAFFESFVK